jgi:hypothetical protein
MLSFVRSLFSKEVVVVSNASMINGTHSAGRFDHGNPRAWWKS